ncbi:MAG: hypothetical protein WCS73_02085 [Lentisphaeria bacterium]
MQKRIFLLLAFVTAVTIGTTGCRSIGNGKARFDTLLLTGNFLESRLLCELAQYKTKQPMMIFSADADGTQQIFYVPANNKVVQLMSESEFVEMIEFINPKKVIVVGNSSYVPAKYTQMVPVAYPVIQLSSKNWDCNAQSLGQILNQNRLPKVFRTNYTKVLQAETQGTENKAQTTTIPAAQ